MADDARRIRDLEAALTDRDYQLREQQRVVEDIVAGRHMGREDPMPSFSNGHHVDGFGGPTAWTTADQIRLYDSTDAGQFGQARYQH